ncbi:hypothetical protein CHS0354_018525 [Potamilus streckersoni]|uniref:DUF1275 domain-containing protein n=1 Tax=Potamilus streckersoni TaxID=2493646 RepID=A0AAE0WAB6_9BIVA|nr:hypothetical protein CHS0354_018525 [Potamilus streckersoni]
MMLTFNAGVINAVVLTSFANGVSHMTGVVVRTAIHLTQREGYSLREGILILVSFMAGAVFSGMVIRSQSFKAGRRYGVVMTTEALFLTLSAYIFYRGGFWGELPAAFACGMQNAMITIYSGSVIRTTHLTGTITDIGTALGYLFSDVIISLRQYALHKYRRMIYRAEEGKNRPTPLTFRRHMTRKLRRHLHHKILRLFFVFVSFFTGALTGTVLFDTFSFNTLLFSAAFIGTAGVLYTVRQHRLTA